MDHIGKIIFGKSLGRKKIDDTPTLVDYAIQWLYRLFFTESGNVFGSDLTHSNR